MSLLITFIFLKLIDVSTTYYALNYIPGVYEVNPLVEWSIEALGVEIALSINFFFCGAGAGWIYKQSRIKLLYFLTLLYYLIAANNIIIILLS